MVKQLITLILIIALFSIPSLGRLETLQVGSHIVSMNIPDFPKYYIASTLLGEQEAIDIKFNQSLLTTLLLGPEHMTITIDNYPQGVNGTIDTIENAFINYGHNNYPGNFTVYKKNMVGSIGIVIEHPLSNLYKNINEIEAIALIDVDSFKKPHGMISIVSDYDRIVTGSIMDSIVVKRIGK